MRYNQATHFVYDKLIFKGVAAQVGLDRVRWFLSGSAPLADDISQFFKVVFRYVAVECGDALVPL